MVDFDNLMVLVPAGEILNGDVVVKRTGINEYRVTRELKVYREGEGGQVVASARDGEVFLFSDGVGNVNVCRSDVLVLWRCGLDDLVSMASKRKSSSEEWRDMEDD